jgi:putative ABC transport system permease protein
MGWMRRLFHKSREEKRLDQELRDHLERQAAAYIAAGIAPQEARRRAQIEFGGLDRVKEEVRDTRAEIHVDNLFRDFHYAFRNLRKDWRFALTAIFALALGISASTVAFSAFYNLLFNAFAAKDASRLVVFSLENAETGTTREANLEPLSARLSDLDAIRAENHVFEDVVGYGQGITLLHDGEEVHQLYRTKVTANSFDFYGVPPLLGRGIITADGVAGASQVFVMSYRTWVGEFNADPRILGKSFVVDDSPRTLVGIMPARFQAYGALVQVWTPITSAPGPAVDETSVGTMMARLRPGVGLEAASADLDVIVRQLAKGHPNDFPKHFSARVITATDFLMGPFGIGSAETQHFDIKHMLYNLLAGAVILLLIACSNVANLLLARATVREREIAVRRALGATRGRLIQQLLVESLALALGACALGCGFAYFGMKGVTALIPHKGWSVGGEAVIGLDWPILLFVLMASLATTVLCGLAPALHAVRRDLQPALVGGGKGTAVSFRHGKLRAGLVIGQVALSILLLTGAGLMIRSFFLLTHIDLGFKLDNLLFVAFRNAHGGKFTSPQEEITFQKILEGLRALPGVEEVAINSSLPGYNPGLRHEVTVPGSSRVERAGIDGCSENLFQTLELRLMRGRWLSQDDVASARQVAVINQTMALHFFGGEDPVGRQFTAKAFAKKGQPPQDADFQVVGVLRDMKDVGPQVPVIPMAFIPYTITSSGPSGLLFIRTKVAPASLMHVVQEQVWAFNRNVIFSPQSGPYRDTFEMLTYSAYELGLMTFAPLAGIALLLVMVGVFSVMAYNVSLQTQEIGVRMALGAQSGTILTMVLKKGVHLVAAGIVLGLFASFALTRFLSSQIWGVSATDPWTFASVVALVILVGLVACLLPARRAAMVDPLVALRYE